jgi:membrane protein DedA with SNARE-associated domain
VLAAAISFLPFKVATIASGVSGLALAPFLLASLVGRGIRFFGVAALVYYFGPNIQKFIDRYFNSLSLTFVVLLLLGFLLLGSV